MSDEPAYYYAAGSPISLEPDFEHLVVDLDRLEAEGVESETADCLRQTGHQLKRHLYMVERRELSEGLADRLEASAALQPVFRHGETLLVVLPEVRVEAPEEEQQAAVREFLGSSDIPTEVVRDHRGRFVLRPASGRGLDALRLANRLWEEVRPEMAQARFVRVVPRRAASPAG